MENYKLHVSEEVFAHADQESVFVHSHVMPEA